MVDSAFRWALLQSVVGPSLQTASSFHSAHRVLLALELSTAFVTLLRGIYASEGIREAILGLTAVDRILSLICVHFYHTSSWAACISNLFELVRLS